MAEAEAARMNGPGLRIVHALPGGTRMTRANSLHGSAELEIPP